jgi:hypothetical protein
MTIHEQRIQTILRVAQELRLTGQTAASTGEHIAAAFALGRMDLLPMGYSPDEAWERLGSWQRYVMAIRQQGLIIPSS